MSKLRNRGSMLIKAVITTSMISVSCFGIMKMTQYKNEKQNFRTNRLDAYYTVENAILEGMQIVADEEEDPDQVCGVYYLGDPSRSLDLPYTPGSEVKYCALKIEEDPMGVEDNYLLTAAARVENRPRAMQALVRWHPCSKVFDYEYFLNNWGWWWGGSIHGYGHNRSNWDFDFKYRPYVYGHIFANGEVESNRNPVNPFEGSPPFRGYAGNDPLTYCHTGTPRVPMPNLMDLSYYEGICNGTIMRDGEILIDAVHGDDESKTGIYLEGTYDDPLEINGSVVIHGDVIIKGYVTGQGVLYTGGNLYIADEIRYKDGPDFNPAPETMEDENRDDWVDSNMDKDIVAYAVRGAIYTGRVNTSGWKSYCYNPRSYGLKYVGDESELGADGIANTPDDGIPYWDTNGDGAPDSAWYDADDDGEIDSNYNYYNDIKMTDSRRNNIANYPTDDWDNPLDYNSVATDYQNYWEGIFYTNHAFGSYTRSGPSNYNGAMICRDEAIIFTSRLYFRYDSRIHSRYQRKYYQGDPNRIIDMQLPIAEDVCALDRYEIPPLEIY